MESSGEFQGSGRFRIVRRVGAGGMGVVYEAQDVERGMRVALKTLPQISPHSLYLFKNEFRALAGVSHPNLVTLYELLNERDHWFFTMQYIEGVDLLSYVTHATQVGQPLEVGIAAGTDTMTFAAPSAPPSRQCDYERLRDALAQVVTGLAALHADSKVHRDIKPSNVLVTPEGRAVILDFGLVHDFNPVNVRVTSVIAGSAAYMSPEQAAGQPPTVTTDWYSVGVVLYEALTGNLPHSGSVLELLQKKQTVIPPPPSEIAPGIPPDLNHLCVALLAAEPAQRPGANEILSRLRGGQVLAVPREQPEKPLFVGRKAEMATLYQAFQKMRAGQAVVVSIEGASGLGKSTLVREFLERSRETEGAAVMTGRCYEQESVPYKAFDDLIDGLTTYLRRLSNTEVAALMPRDTALLVELFPVFGRLPAVASARGRGIGTLERQEIRRRAFQAVRELFSRLGDRIPLILAIDDLQWGDRDSADLLAETLRQPDGPALLLIVAYRREYAGRSVALGALLSALDSQAVTRLHIALAPLAGEETHELAQRLLASAEIRNPALLDTIVRESQGNAYFVRELIQNAKEERSTDAVNLESVILDRVSSLPPEPKALLETIAIAGQPIPQSVAYQAAGIRGSDPACMALLRSMRLVRTGGSTLADDVEPYHDRIRESIVGKLAPAVLEQRHRSLAQAFEDGNYGEPESLAVHLELGGEPERALLYYRRAADTASGKLAFDRAVNLYSRALALVQQGSEDRAALLESLADAQANAGFSLEAAHAYQQLVTLPGFENRTDLARKAAYQFCIGGHAQEGTAAFQTVLRRAGLRMPPSPLIAVAGRIALLMWLRIRGVQLRPRPASLIRTSKLEAIDVSLFMTLGLSTINPYAGNYFSALAVTLALRAGESGRALKALAWEAVVTAAFPAGLARAQHILESCEAIRAGNDTAVNRGFIAMSRGMVLFESGRFAQANTVLQEAETALAECSGVNLELNATRTFRLWALVCMGQCGELAAIAPVWYRDALNRGDAYTAANVGAYSYVFSLLGQDDPVRASAIHEQSMSLWPAQEYTLQKMMAGLGRGYIDLYIDDADAAWRGANEHWKRARGVFLLLLENVAAYMRHWRGVAALAMAEHARRTGGDPTPFIRAAEKDGLALRRLKLSHGPAMGEAVLAGVAGLRADRNAAIAHLKSAAQRFDVSPMPSLAEIARRELGRLLGGDEGAAIVRSAEEKLSSYGVRNLDSFTRIFVRGLSAS